MKRLLLHCAAAGTAIMLAGCSHEDDGNHAGKAAEQPAEVGVIYHPQKGLLIPVETAKFIGLETAEVSERPVSASREVSARVFQAATTSESRALASAVVTVVDAASLKPGIKGITATGTLTSSVLRLDRTQESWVEVILQVEDGARSLPLGEFVTFRFTEHSTNAVTAVPRAALLHTTEGDFVYTVNGEHFVRAAVKLGRLDSEFAEVTDGLYVGDKIVVRPVMTLWMTELHNVNGGDACCIVSKPKE